MSARFLPAGDRALVVEFGDAISRDLSRRVLALDAALRRAALPGVVETVPTFRSLLVHYDPLRTSGVDLEARLAPFVAADSADTPRGRSFRVPICTAPPFAPDLAEVAARTGLAPDEVIAVHAATEFYTFMVGFLPGLPYLGELDPRFRLPRRANPRVRVPRGSVGIAMGQSTIYPVESPGGWHLIGATPVRMFDPARTPPALLAAGDTVRFVAIDEDEFAKMRAAADAGEFWLAPEKDAAP